MSNIISLHSDDFRWMHYKLLFNFKLEIVLVCMKLKDYPNFFNNNFEKIFDTSDM